MSEDASSARQAEMAGRVANYLRENRIGITPLDSGATYDFAFLKYGVSGCPQEVGKLRYDKGSKFLVLLQQ